MSYDIHLGDCLESLRDMPSESVQMVVTSPPYWSLRDYGIEPSVWGGDNSCSHDWGDDLPGKSASPHNFKLERKNDQRKDPSYMSLSSQGCFCSKCGAWLGQLGLEPTPQLFVKHIVMIFQEVKRVLRDDGTIWVNFGDSFSSGGRSGSDYLGDAQKNAQALGKKETPGLAPKNLIGIPWRVALALQDDGWYLRSDNIWYKPNAMPESVTDRPTKAHEYMFLLSKSERYYYDADAVRQPLKAKTYTTFNTKARAKGNDPLGLVKSDNWHSSVKERKPKRNDKGEISGANLRSVWCIPTVPYSEAHFATFPPELAEICIAAGSKRGDTVMDIFSGSGTAGEVALKLGRSYIGLEAKPEYVELSHKRIAPTFNQPRLLEPA